MTYKKTKIENPKSYKEQRDEGLHNLETISKDMPREMLIQWIRVAYNQDTEQILFLMEQLNASILQRDLFNKNNKIANKHIEELKNENKALTKKKDQVLQFSNILSEKHEITLSNLETLEIKHKVIIESNEDRLKQLGDSLKETARVDKLLFSLEMKHETLTEKHENAVDDADRLEKYVEELVQHLQATTKDPDILEVAANYYNSLTRT